MHPTNIPNKNIIILKPPKNIFSNQIIEQTSYLYTQSLFPSKKGRSSALYLPSFPKILIEVDFTLHFQE